MSNEYDMDIADCSEAIRMNPNEMEAYHNRGFLYEKTGDYDKTIADFEAALRFDPK